MKTKTEKELEREIEEEKQEIERKERAGISEELNENYSCLYELKAKLEGYRKAKEEFNKKVEELRCAFVEDFRGLTHIKVVDTSFERFLKLIDKLAGEKLK